ARSSFLGPCLQAPHAFDFASAMDEGRSIVINLNESAMGDDSRIAAAMFMAKYSMDARRRRECPFDHVLFADECQEYATHSLVPLLSRRQKRGLAVVASHQDSNQIDDELIALLIANTKIHCSFVLGNMDTARAL